MIRLDRPWDMLLLHKVDAEEHEGFGWAGDVSLTLSLARWALWVRALMFLLVGRGW